MPTVALPQCAGGKGPFCALHCFHNYGNVGFLVLYKDTMQTMEHSLISEKSGTWLPSCAIVVHWALLLPMILKVQALAWPGKMDAQMGHCLGCS